jgi:predicted membrane chloride channel (bestrophin family)
MRTPTNPSTSRLFQGSPRLLLRALPWMLAIVALKWLLVSLDVQPFDLSPLLAGSIAAEVFVVGFLLSGTASDFKEAERLPGEIAASLETIADECLIVHRDLGIPAARQCLVLLAEVNSAVREWLTHNQAFDHLMADLRALNEPFRAFAPLIQPGFTTRLKSEQASIRKTVLRMDTMRRTSYVAAGYLIGEVTAVALVVVLLVSDLGPLAPTLALVGLIAYLLVYLIALIRDLDDPFEYLDGQPGAADVDLGVLERNAARILALVADIDEGRVPVTPRPTA